MAIWVTLNKKYSWKDVAEIGTDTKFNSYEWERYDISNLGHNAIRIGFAAYDENEMQEFITKMKTIFSIIDSSKNKILTSKNIC
jgi:GntR family transcriptional regulator/MocR family aminotransferase